MPSGHYGDCYAIDGWTVGFRRQEPIGQYIVDFICFEARLIIEVDGGQHFESTTDKTRDTFLESQGFRVLRLWNTDVLARHVAARGLPPGDAPCGKRGQERGRREQALRPAH